MFSQWHFIKHIGPLYISTLCGSRGYSSLPGVVVYNQGVRMGKSKNSRSALCSTRLLLIVLSISALTVSLVTRTFRIHVLQCTTAQSNSPQVLRQHLDHDATHWAPPILHFSTLLVCTIAPRTPTVWLRLPSLLLDESLYNRPPPSC